REDAGAALAGVTGLDQLQELEATGTADRCGDLPRGDLPDQVRERGRDLVLAAPAQVAAFQRVRTVGVAHRGGGEIHLAPVEQALEPDDLFLPGGHLLGGWQ